MEDETHKKPRKKEVRKRIIWNKETFIQAGHTRHGKNRYDYSKILEWKTITDRVTLICHRHEPPHEWSPIAANHVLADIILDDGSIKKMAQGCNICAKLKRSEDVKAVKGISPTGALERALEIHKDLYDYSEMNFQGIGEVITVICKVEGHGRFYPTANNHIWGKTGCPKCGRLAGAEKRKSNPADVIALCEKRHPGKYGFEKAVYVDTNTDFTVFCKKHQSYFEIWPQSLIRGGGCPHCYLEDGSNAKFNYERFVKVCTIRHDDRYGYDRVDFENIHDEVDIWCKKHQYYFTQTAVSHRDGRGCPKCAASGSAAQKEVAEFIRNLGLEVIENHRPDGHNTPEIDIFIPELRIGIEYNGLYMHREDSKPRGYHLKKTEHFKTKGVHVIHIFEDLWIQKRDVCEKWLISQLGKSSFSLNGRDCIVKRVANPEVEGLIDSNHIQGMVAGCEFVYGIYHKAHGLVGAMLFSRRNGLDQRGEVVLERFCTTNHVRGAFSKMLKFFLQEQGHLFEKIVSFSDRSWSRGRVYVLNGFTHVGSSEPGYWWCKNQKRFNRRNFQRKFLPARLKFFDPSKSERENCEANGYTRLWDCGLDKWELIIPK